MKIKIVYLLIFYLFAVSCGETENTDAFNFIDLSIKHKVILNSIRIENDGKAIILVNILHKEPQLYSVEFNKKEMNYIKNSIAKIQWSKYDSLSNYSMDGTQYNVILNKNNQTIIYSSGVCGDSKEVDDLVFYIEKAYEKKKKNNFYNSIDGLIPPPPPIELKSESID